MHTSQHTVNPCTTIGHTYVCATIVICDHDHSVTVGLRGWVDDDQDDPIVLSEATHTFGPFDTTADIAALASMQLADLVELLGRSRPL